MNKSELVDAVAAVVSSKKEAQEAVECVFDTIKKALKKNETVQIVGFGSFKVNERDARKGRNPQTGKEIQIAARKVPKFIPGKALKDALN
jgi:DNA-binding protein HU-beta